jgi:hypothetical protein
MVSKKSIAKSIKSLSKPRLFVITSFLVVLLSASVSAIACSGLGIHINPYSVSEPDNFYSNHSGNDVIHINAAVTCLNYSDSGPSGLVQANFSNVSAACGVVNMTNQSALVNDSVVPVNFSASCNVSNESANTSGFVGGAVIILAFSHPGPPDDVKNQPIVLYDMPVPPEGDPCMNFGPETTNFRDNVSNFSGVNFIIENKMNLTCYNPTLSGPAWMNQFTTLALFNFTSVNLSTPEQAQKLSQLPQNMDVRIVPLRKFGMSRIYFNTSFFNELNTTSIVKLFHLPFTSTPALLMDLGAAGNSTPINFT